MKSLTISLDDDIYERLCKQAQSKGVPPEEAAGDAVRKDLNQPRLTPEEIAEERAALERLVARAATLPDIDVVELVRASREELEGRAQIA